MAGWSVGARSGRPPPSETTSTRTPGGAIASTWSRSRAKIRSGSWSATSRHVILAWARPGMIVLLPSPCEAAPDPVDVEGRAGPASLQRGPARLPDEGRHVEGGAVGLVVERQPREGGPVGLGEGDDVVVEAGDADPAVGALERGDDRRQRVDRVVDRAAVLPGVDVLDGPADVDLGRADAPQADRDRREVALEEARRRRRAPRRRPGGRRSPPATGRGGPSWTPPRPRRRA